MKYALGNMLSGGGALNPDGLELDLAFALDNTLTARKGPTPTFTRASTATFIGSDGLIQTDAINAPRFDYDPVTLVSKGLLIEEQRTNLLLRSEEFDNASWNASSLRNLVISANSANSPSGLATADKLTVGSTTTTYQALQNTSTLTSGTAYTVSCYFKADQVTRVSIWSGNTTTLPFDAFFDLTGNGSVTANAFGSASIQKLSNGWYRCIITGTAGASSSTSLRVSPATAGNSRTYVGNSVDSFYAWGAQLEAGAFPTSYVATTTASVTRSADVCSITGANFTSFYNQSEGTISVSSISPASGNRSIIGIDDNTSNEMIRLRTEGADPFYRVVDGGSEVVALDLGSISANNSFKIAAAYAANDFAASLNGGAASTDTVGTLPTVDRIRIGADQGGNTFTGTIGRISYYRKRLANSKLQTLST